MEWYTEVEIFGTRDESVSVELELWLTFKDACKGKVRLLQSWIDGVLYALTVEEYKEAMEQVHKKIERDSNELYERYVDAINTREYEQ